MYVVRHFMQRWVLKGVLVCRVGGRLGTRHGLVATRACFWLLVHQTLHNGSLFASPHAALSELFIRALEMCQGCSEVAHLRGPRKKGLSRINQPCHHLPQLLITTVSVRRSAAASPRGSSTKYARSNKTGFGDLLARQLSNL